MKKIFKNKLLVSALITLGFCFSAQAVPVDLNTWTEESYPAVSGFGAGSWAVSGAGDSVYQSVNGQPTLFYSDFNTFGSSFTGSINVSGGDDDFIGFALGFNAGDTGNSAADYLLIDWKKATQTYDFGAPSTTPGSTANIGLSVSRVSGVPTADEFWGHENFASNANGGLEELQRATNLGSTGWNAGTAYEFTFDFGPNDLDVYVNNILELSISGSFNDGSFGFYNFSQAGVTYSGFEQQQGTYPTPAPSVLVLMIMGIAGIYGTRRKKI